MHIMVAYPRLVIPTSYHLFLSTRVGKARNMVPFNSGRVMALGVE